VSAQPFPADAFDQETAAGALERANSLCARGSAWALALMGLHAAALWVWGALPPSPLSAWSGGALAACAGWFVWELGRASAAWLRLLEAHSLMARQEALATFRQAARDAASKRRAARG
jgi:hypothetical protein